MEDWRRKRRPRVLASACLLGVPCRYDGVSKPCPGAIALTERYELIPVCPEQLGGLPTPRPPAEIQESQVVNRLGQNVTEAYQKGAQEALALYRLLGCDAAILKARSPSCGCGQVYDGSFSGTLAPGYGVTASLLRAQGVPVFTEDDELAQRFTEK